MLKDKHQKAINKGVSLWFLMRHLLQNNILLDARDRIGHIGDNNIAPA
jgi:hypothetical protein